MVTGKYDEECRHTSLEDQYKDENLKKKQEEVAKQNSSENVEVENEDIKDKKLDYELEKANQKLEEKQQEAEKYKNLLLRSKADFENYRKRAKRDIQNARLYAAEDFVIDILSVVDNFERALDSVEDKSDSVYKGVELIYQQFIKLLEKHNIKEIEAEGKPFDPRYHQAVMQIETEEYESNTVAEVIQKGYLYNSKVIRPSMVKVAKN